jgi:CAAX prenyl protease-like protein
MNKNALSASGINSPGLIMRYYTPHIVPLILLGFFIYVGPLLDVSKAVVYPLQTIAVAASLIFYWKVYREEVRFETDLMSVVAGVAVFFIWVLPEGLYPQMGKSEFNPYDLAQGRTVYFLMAFRLLGAAFVVPLVEELFWRSFALRFLIKSDFKKVPLGQFSWLSFVGVSVAFGFEHHRWLVGIMAGMIYALVLYRSKNLFSPILAHTVTNLLLGLYVIATGKWDFW